MPDDKRLVYLLKSANPKAHYCPWQLHVIIELPDEQQAVAFERYLKSPEQRFIGPFQRVFAAAE